MINVPWENYFSDLLSAFWVTVQLAVLGFSGAVLVGIVLAVMRISKMRILNLPSYLVVEVLKNMPILTGLFILYFGFTSIGVVLDGFTSGVIALALFYGGYLAEIFRGGLQGVTAGQLEAAQAVGLTPARTFGAISLPQAARLALPSTATILVDLLKGTSLLVTIGGGELMTQASLITADTYRAFEVYLVIGLIYLAMCWPLSRLSGALERVFAEGRALSPNARKVRHLTCEAISAEHSPANEVSASTLAERTHTS